MTRTPTRLSQKRDIGERHGELMENHCDVALVILSAEVGLDSAGRGGDDNVTGACNAPLRRLAVMMHSASGRPGSGRRLASGRGASPEFSWPPPRLVHQRGQKRVMRQPPCDDSLKRMPAILPGEAHMGTENMGEIRSRRWSSAAASVARAKSCLQRAPLKLE